MSRLLGLLGPLVLVAGCGAPVSRDAWKRARDIAERYLRTQYGEPPAWEIHKQIDGAPFLFRVRTPRELFVLVHGDQVEARRGLTALDRYLRESHATARRTMTAAELVMLIELLEALPPHTSRGEPAPRDFHRFQAAPALRPRLDYLDGDRARLALYYRSHESGDAPSDADEPPAITEWTLAIDPIAPAVWTSKLRTYDAEQGRLLDVDHAK